MKIVGLQKLTLLDYPGQVACTVFLGGCNFRCPFCHNGQLLENAPAVMSTEELLAFLKGRKGILDGVCITGGEPTLNPQLPELMRQIKQLGYLVKLDTNGTRPQVVKELVTRGLVDYVAMDIKNSPARYGETAGVSRLELEAIEETMGFLMAGNVDFEFRTTVVAELHRAQDMKEIGQWLQKLSPDKKPAKLFLQAYADRDSVLMGGLSAHSKETMQEFKDILAPYADIVELRGIS